MTQTSTTLIHRYAGVAIVVALISGFGTFTDPLRHRFISPTGAGRRQAAPCSSAR
jgi:hypothetical protein